MSSLDVRPTGRLRLPATARAALGAGVAAAMLLPAAPALAAGPNAADGTSGTAASSATSTHITKDLVILAYWTAPDSMTQAAAQAEVANDDAWFKEVSYGAEGISAVATPWVKIADPGPRCNEASIVSGARTGAAALGYNYREYDRTLVYFPRATCTYAGSSSLDSDHWSVFNGGLSTSVTAHEQGHLLGIDHAHSYICTGADGGFITMADFCEGDDYGDPYDTMGRGNAVHYNGADKAMLGWLPDGRLVDMTPGTSTTLAPLEQQAAAPQVAKLQVSSGRTYYIEYRQLMGLDSYLGWADGTTHGTDGVLIHAIDNLRTYWRSGTSLLDMVPDGDFYDATLKSGQSWTTPEGWTITVGAITPAGASVSVTGPTLTAPSAPLSVSATAGDASASVSWSPPSSDGGSAVTGYTLTSTPGGLTTTVPASSRSATLSGLANGTSYTFTVTATNGVGTSVSSAPSNAVTPKAPVQSSYQETALSLNGWKVISDATATDGSYRSATAVNETSSFTFSGTSVTVQARGNSAAGKAKITIDGVVKGTVDLYRSTPTAISLPYTGLKNKAHTIVVTATGTKSTASTGTAVNVDGYQVGSVTTSDSDSAVTYTGWTGAANAAASGGAYRTSKTANTTVSYSFNGTAVSWLTATGPAYGKAQVLIDGVSRGTFDQYAAAASWQTARAFSGLSAGQHTITIKALGSKNPASTGTSVVVDALTVTS